MNDTKIKQNIAEARESLGMTQNELAEKLGICRQAYINFEHGRTVIVNRTLEKIASVVKVSPEKLILGYDPEERRVQQLREKEEMEFRYGRMNEKYEEQLKDLQESILMKDQIIESQRKTIEGLEGIRALLVEKISKINH